MNKKFTSMVIATLVSASNFAIAGMHGTYVTAKGGLSILHNQSDEKAGLKKQLKYKTMFNAGAAVGQKIDMFRTELEGNYVHAKVDNIETTTGGTSRKDESNSKAGSLLSITLNGYYDIQVDPNFEPYVGIGLGWGHFKSNYVNDTVPTDKASNAMAFQGMLGIQYHVNHAMSILLEYKFLGTTQVVMTNIAGDDYKDMVAVHNFNLGFKFTIA